MNNRRQNNPGNVHFPCTFPHRQFPPNNHQNNSPNSPPSAHQNEILPQNSPQSCSPQNAPEFLGTSPDQECLNKSTPSPAFQCCSLCGQFIVDTHLAKIFPDRFLHENCARCSICSCQFLASPSTLSANCFEREGRFFCRMHYLQCFPPPPSAAPPTLCAGCGTAIEAADLVYKLKASIVFHVGCHRCVHCGCQLGQGQQIVVDERSKAVACAIHFEGNALAEMIAENQSRIGEELFPGNGGNGQQGNALGIQGMDLANGQNASTDFGVPNGIVEQMQKEAQIGQQMANAQQRLFDAAQQMADEGMLGGEGMAMSCQNELAQTILMPNQSIQADLQIAQPQQSQSSPISLHFPPPPLQNIQQFCHQISPQNGQQQQIHAENAVGIFDCQQQNLNEREERESIFVGGSGIGRENGHQEEMGQNIGGGNKKKKSSSSSPAACTKSNQPSSAFLDGIVLTTVQNIKAAVGAAAVENRQKDGGGEEEEGAGKKKKEKAGAAIHRRTSSGAGSSTTPPAPIVPQYPFEMYAAGEQFSRQEEEFQQNGQGNKRRGPRTTISQQQLDILNRIFTTTPKPTKHARAKLAMDAGLSMRVIQVWFQNRRSKERRLKHLCNFLRHCDGGTGGGDGQNQMLESSRMEEDEEDEGGEGNDGIGGRIMLVKEEERSEFDERAEAIEGFDSVGADEFCC